MGKEERLRRGQNSRSRSCQDTENCECFWFISILNHCFFFLFFLLLLLLKMVEKKRNTQARIALTTMIVQEDETYQNISQIVAFIPNGDSRSMLIRILEIHLVVI